MAPTEVLARQHADTMAPLADAAGIALGLLTGREKGRPRADLLERLAAGEIDILIGTHALFQQDVAFRDLAFAVIDEQHRFGVHQRLALQTRAAAAAPRAGDDGDADPAHPADDRTTATSTCRASPRSRPAASRSSRARSPVDGIERLIAGACARARRGRPGLLGVPADRESDKSELAAAEERHAHLVQMFGESNVGLLHGAMPARPRTPPWPPSPPTASRSWWRPR